MPEAPTARRVSPRLETALVYDAPQRMNGSSLLRQLGPACATMMVMDPQYRGVLDKLKYGNEGVSREKKRADLPVMTEYTIARFIEEAQRILKPSGHLLLWIDKYMLAKARHLAMFAYVETLEPVELIHWNKLRMGMGKRGRCQSEYLVIAQKKPISAKMWTDRRITDTWPEMVDRSRHPHTKPHQLLERLVKTLSKRGDLIVDPCAGGYTTLDVCRMTGRRFVGCDLSEDFLCA